MNERQPETLAEKIEVLGPVTRDRLEDAERRLNQPPVPEHHCVPDSMTVETIKRLQRENDVIDAAYIKSRLDRVAGRPTRAFTKAAVGEAGEPLRTERNDVRDVFNVRGNARYKRPLTYRR